MKLRLLAAAVTTAALVVPASAAAQAAPSALDSAAVVSAEKPKNPQRQKDAVVKIADIGNLKGGSARILSKVPVSGTIAPFVKGQRIKMTYYLNGKELFSRSAKVQKRGKAGFFKSSIAIRKGGKYAVSAKHVATKAQKGDSTVRKSWKVTFPDIPGGKCGKLVGEFRKRLNDMGFVPGGGKCFNGKMGRAVLAFRKVNDMTRKTKAGKRIVKMVFSGQGGYNVRYEKAGEHVEAPLSKQVIVFARGDKVEAVYPVSSGAPSTPTVQGHFEFIRTEPGYNSLGMLNSFYFYGGYAIHGYHSVPNYPASHGCLRTFVADQPEIFNRIDYGEDIFVF